MDWLIDWLNFIHTIDNCPIMKHICIRKIDRLKPSWKGSLYNKDSTNEQWEFKCIVNHGPFISVLFNECVKMSHLHVFYVSNFRPLKYLFRLFNTKVKEGNYTCIRNFKITCYFYKVSHFQTMHEVILLFFIFEKTYCRFPFRYWEQYVNNILSWEKLKLQNFNHGKNPYNYCQRIETIIFFFKLSSTVYFHSK
jgi:hypothetical protein